MVMTEGKHASRSGRTRRGQEESLKDEVYRQMFRLEANRPGAELELSVALLRSWIAPCPEPEHAKLSAWLNKVCPICLQMIEAARQSDSGTRCIP